MTEERRETAGGRSLGVIVAVVVAALAASGCSSGSGGPSVASVPGRGGASQQPAALTVAQSDRDMLDFTRCMRDHGVQMSDPFHRSGHQGLSIDLPPQNATTRAAYGACSHFMAQIDQAKQAGAAPAPAADLQALAQYARCMRSHDIDLLDPTPDGALSLGDVPGITDHFGRYSPQFRAADAACRHLLPAGVHDDGTGP